ncbi:unknown [Ruminococcus sp. CAG:579]|nr:unknown [Ruminococcus sp. CAG:579]
MNKIDLEFLKKEITGGTNTKVPLFFIIVFGIVIAMMLVGSVNSPHDVKVAIWGISAGLVLVCVVICGILPLLSHKKNSNELRPEDIRVKKRAAADRYKKNDKRWVAFKGEEDDYIVSNDFYHHEFASGREFYIISRVQMKNGRETEKLIGIYPADVYTIDTNEIFVERS